MLIFFDRAQGSVPKSCDLLVVGAGPAGLTLALEVARARSDFLVVIAEAGGLEPPPPELGDLYAGRSLGAPYPIETSRLRYFGGTSGHWGGWCRPLDSSDLLPAPAGAGPGWPIARSDLYSALQAAHTWCEIPNSSYDASEILARHPGRLLDLRDSALFDNALFRFSPPTRFGTRYRPDVETQENLNCVLNAAAVRLLIRDRTCEGVLIKSINGAARVIEASMVVLATGGMETTRLLLQTAARPDIAIDGLRSPALGSYFADHPGLRPGELLAPAGLRYARFDEQTGAVMPLIVPRPKAMQERNWMNACIALNPLPAGGDDRPSYAGNPGFGLAGEHWRYRVHMIVEPHAVSESRITLDQQTDRLGVPRLRLDWRVSRRTIESGVAIFAALARELGRLGLGRGRILPVDVAAEIAAPSHGFHHLGTTRMADSPSEGVVDRNLRVHGSDNLYVVSSSVFPRFGFSNPTLTIVALACRAAAHLANDRSRAA